MPHSTAQPRTVLHIGPPKTGTTTLQEQVFPRLRSVCFLGKPWWNPTVPYDKCVALHRAIDSVTKADRAAYDAGAARAAVQTWLNHAPDAAPRADGSLLPRLLSEERLTFSDVVPLDEIAARLAQLFPGAEIVYVRRDPVSGLRSFHRWLYARAWTDAGFSDWLAGGLAGREDDHAAVALRSYDWGLLESAFGAHFPVVRSLDFKDMLADPVAYLARLVGHDDPEFGAFAWLRDRPLNVSRGRGASELHRLTKKSIRLWNRLPFRKIDEKPEYLGDTPRWQRLERLAARIPLSEARLTVTDQDRARIHDHYAAGGQDRSVPN